MLRNDWGQVAIIALAAIVCLSLFSYFHQRAEVERAKQAAVEQRQKKESIEAEYVRRRALAESESSTPSEISDGSVDPGLAPPPERTEKPPGPNFETFENVEIVTSGPYKGMTRAAAKEASRRELQEAKAAATRRHEWNLRYRAASQRLRENIRKQIALGDTLVESADAELSAMLALLSLLSDEQLDYARQELLKDYPSADVDPFFAAIANRAARKTPEQLDKDIRKLLSSREAYDAVDRELEIEWMAIQQEFAELDRTKP